MSTEIAPVPPHLPRAKDPLDLDQHAVNQFGCQLICPIRQGFDAHNMFKNVLAKN